MKKSHSPYVVLCLCILACGTCFLSSCQSTKVAATSATSSDMMRQQEFEETVRMLVETE